MDANKHRRELFVILPLVMMVLTGQAQARDRKAPVIKHQAVHKATQGQNLVLSAKISDHSGLFEPTLYYRLGHKGTFKRLPLIKQGASYQATIPAAEMSGTRLEYFLESYDQQGNGPARFGEPNKAIQVKLKAKAVVVNNPNQKTQAGDQNSTHTDTNKPDVHEVAATEIKGSETANSGQVTKHSENKEQADDEKQDLTPWIIVGASTLGVVVIAGVVGGIFWWNASQTPDTPPGDVTLQVGAPPPYSSALRASP